MGLIDSQSIQGGKGLTLVPLRHPKADFGGNFVGKLFLISEFCSSDTLDFEPIWMSPSESESEAESESGLREPGESRSGEVECESGLDESGYSTKLGFPTNFG